MMSLSACVIPAKQCAVSNLAFATDATRTYVGRICAVNAVSVTKLFNADPFLFSMALRAVGNLTRCDENIMRVVGFGVMKGISQGMRANFASMDVLKLSAGIVLLLCFSEW